MKMLPAVGTCIGTRSGSFDSLQLIRSDAELQSGVEADSQIYWKR
jgi:hypothetical protein